MARSKEVIKKIFRFLMKLFLVFVIGSVLWVLTYRWVDPPITYLMVERYFAAEEGSIQKEWRDLEDISVHMQLAVIAAEDQLFLDHWGFDLNAIDKALEQNKNGKGLKGASTISQQTAKNVFLWHGRTWLRKGLEVWFTSLIELLWGKQRILEVYLNVIELGEGVYGVEAASMKNYKINASKLSKEQAALIAAVLPNPRKMFISKPSPYVIGRQQWILRQMRNLEGLLNDQFTD